MSTVTSADGTPIDYESYGEGPAVIFIAGAIQHRAIDPGPTTAARLLGRRGFRAVVYDRRGRGRSGDTPPWALARESEDVAALVAVAGGAATLCSGSSGAAVAIEAALAGPGISGLVLYEPPFFPGQDKADQISAIAAFLAEGDHDAAMRYNLTDVVGIPAPVVDGMATSSSWPAMCAAAPTLVYDLTAVSAINTDPDWHSRWTDIAAPVTVVSGSASFPGLAAAADRVAAAIPGAQRRVLDGEAHSPAPEALSDLIAHVHESRSGHEA